jgi:hypothetical protein
MEVGSGVSLESSQNRSDCKTSRCVDLVPFQCCGPCEVLDMFAIGRFSLRGNQDFQQRSASISFKGLDGSNKAGSLCASKVNLICGTFFEPTSLSEFCTSMLAVNA